MSDSKCPKCGAIGIKKGNKTTIYICGSKDRKQPSGKLWFDESKQCLINQLEQLTKRLRSAEMTMQIHAGDITSYALENERFIDTNLELEKENAKLQAALEKERGGTYFNLDEIDCLKTTRDDLTEILKNVYRKHWLGCDDVGWDELGEALRDCLCEALGDKDFQAWVRLGLTLPEEEKK